MVSCCCGLLKGKLVFFFLRERLLRLGDKPFWKLP